MPTALKAASLFTQAALTRGCMQQSLLIPSLCETLLSEYNSSTAHRRQRAASSYECTF